jgi:hypothetical protein
MLGQTLLERFYKGFSTFLEGLDWEEEEMYAEQYHMLDYFLCLMIE